MLYVTKSYQSKLIGPGRNGSNLTSLIHKLINELMNTQCKIGIRLVSLNPIDDKYYVLSYTD